MSVLPLVFFKAAKTASFFCLQDFFAIDGQQSTIVDGAFVGSLTWER
jgi:hypothetical protein